MSITGAEELIGLREAGIVVRRMLDAMKEAAVREPLFTVFLSPTLPCRLYRSRKAVPWSDSSCELDHLYGPVGPPLDSFSFSPALPVPRYR
jgi:hypothetical protein